MSVLFAQIKHDFLIEYRSWPQTLALLLFMWTLSYVIYRIRPEITIQEFNFIFWIFLLLISINVAIRGSSHNNDNQRLLIYTLVSPGVVLISRIVFNIIYLAVVALAFYFSMLLLFYPQIQADFEFVLLIGMGALSIGAVLAFIAAISRHVSGQNTAMSVLSIPLLIPVAIILNSIGANLLMGNQLQGGKYIVLSSITLLTIALSMVLFPYIWRE